MLFDTTIAKQLNLQVGFDGSKENELYSIIFMCEEELEKFLKSSSKEMSDLILIIDEAD